MSCMDSTKINSDSIRCCLREQKGLLFSSPTMSDNIPYVALRRGGREDWVVDLWIKEGGLRTLWRVLGVAVFAREDVAEAQSIEPGS